MIIGISEIYHGQQIFIESHSNNIKTSILFFIISMIPSAFMGSLYSLQTTHEIAVKLVTSVISSIFFLLFYYFLIRTFLNNKDYRRFYISFTFSVIYFIISFLIIIYRDYTQIIMSCILMGCIVYSFSLYLIYSVYDKTIKNLDSTYKRFTKTI
jgi:hypothetical protein